jgi:integrase
MAGKQAKVLFNHHVQALLAYATGSRYPVRNRVIVLLSVKAGLRAGEIANLTWPMVVDPTGEIATAIELHDGAAKMGSGRRVPLHNDLREGLAPRSKRRPSVCCLFRTRWRPDPSDHRQLVHHRVSTLGPCRVLVPLGPPNIHHSRREALPV